MSGFYRAHDKGVDIHVRLTPRSSKDAVEGIETASDGRSHLVARVRAVPEKGGANTALEKLLAGWLGVARSDVSVVAGGTSRLKTVRVAGSGAELAVRLDELAKRAPG
ncbi:uncharacterized protein YggU (UPF0235/DUF167 family) [Mesorhizobium soli]|uniref:DUF167 family protein n=1 Tax=Pseudaminobacter soli (ex Li et al. 2025) TaxID=1295366 RepID=UPI0024759BA8|nr:DUF167 family protein [Mesorhizobium soli]MDH6231496.1 uncharacterized protein YggU (UPF0235/DUF167 family) [Mesorhizobium soli]